MAPTQLHPNIWAFMRAFAILCNHLGHPPSVDVFLYFFEAKNPRKKLWLSFNEVARSLEDLNPSDREMCQLLSGLGVVFDTIKLIKLEFCAKVLKIYIGTVLIFAPH